MPYVKFISGHSESTRGIQEYLEKKGRQLAEDFVNATRESLDGCAWSEVMDRTRLDYGTQTARAGQRARRYEHIIISLDPEDDVTLDEFRDYVNGIVEEWFDGGIGRFQVAVVYHDDNSERIANGQEGVLHAHLVINNTELETGLRLSPKLTPKVVNEFAADVNARALERGWHGFAENGVSMTLAKMRERNLSPSKGRRNARLMAEGITAPAIEGEEEYVFADDSNDARRRGAEGAESSRDPVIDVETAQDSDRARADAPDEPGAGPQNEKIEGSRASHGEGRAIKKPVSRRRAARDGTDGEIPSYMAGGRQKVLLRFADGTEHVFEFTRQMTREDIPERRLRERQGYSWKQDIRDRVDVARRLAGSMQDFRQICGMLEVDITYSKSGEIKFSHPSAPDSRIVKGSTLGKDYSTSALISAISLKDVSRRQRAHDLPGRERYMREGERSALSNAARAAKPGTARGASDMKVIREFIAYNDAHDIHSYDDYPDTVDGRAARSYAELIGAFDTTAPTAIDPTAPLLDRLELQRFIREETGAGGLCRTEESRAPGGGVTDDAPAAGGQPRRNR